LQAAQAGGVHGSFRRGNCLRGAGG
jgi:hypothetical protein